jgi:hypothetical protein
MSWAFSLQLCWKRGQYRHPIKFMKVDNPQFGGFVYPCRARQIFRAELQDWVTGSSSYNSSLPPMAPGRLVNLPLCLIAILSTCLFNNLKFGQLAILSACHFVTLPFCQLAILATWHFVNLPFCQLVIFVTLPFCQVAILLTCSWLFVNLLFCQSVIWSNCSFVQLPFLQLAI